MMGMYTKSAGMGDVVQNTGGIVASVGLKLAPLAGPFAPIVALVAAGIGLITRLVHFGPDPAERPDTIVVEAATLGANGIWYAVSGENLGGLDHPEIQPGDFGKNGISLTFGGQPSAYDDGKYATPMGRLGNPEVDINAAIQSAQNTLAQAESQLIRPESKANIEATFAPLMARLNEVARQRALAGWTASGPPSILDTMFTGTSASAWLPWAAAGAIGWLVFE